MSDNESGDDMDDLQSILNEYSGNTNEKTKKKDATQTKTEDKPTEWIKSEEEIRLEKLIFGDKEGLLENLKSSTSKSFEVEQSETKKRKPAWQDEDDEFNMGSARKRIDNAPLKEQLKSRFERIISAPKWANLDRKEEVDSDEEILRTVGFISKTKSLALPSHDISLKKMKELNEKKIEGPITSIQFHPTSTVAMVSGQHCIASLYAIDGERNEKIHSIRFHKFPIECAKILPCGTQAIFGSTKNFYYSYDLMQATETRHPIPKYLYNMANFEVSSNGKYFASSGRAGEMNLFDLKSKDLIHTFKQQEPVKAFKFTLDSTKIIASSTGPSINIFDLRKQRVMHTFLDDGCIRGRSMALSPDGKMLATGSAEGAVNIYEYEKVLASKAPQPMKTILNLTTSITTLNFNHTSEILAMCSKKIKSAVKLVHFPTGTVFANFPGFNAQNLGSVSEIEFSPLSGYMALGSMEKEAKLYRLKHFNNY